eukprot:TRINITY_DN16410_c0_g1_i1.p2 TRINITY_DN16410_c0_g1~~TRINITY_DN16410_c0_g1_i1.p2  ORF type:complete len:109 (+),score=9.56 TRINITY_DN16410_c0_g1_i1:1802-2128(+)
MLVWDSFCFCEFLESPHYFLPCTPILHNQTLTTPTLILSLTNLSRLRVNIDLMKYGVGGVEHITSKLACCVLCVLCMYCESLLFLLSGLLLCVIFVAVTTFWKFAEGL